VPSDPRPTEGVAILATKRRIVKSWDHGVMRKA